MTTNAMHYAVGDRVRVTQQTPRQQGVIRISVEGTIVRFGQQKTGSWFAHSKDDKLWLDRLELRKDDGERIVLNLDRHTVVEGADSVARASRP
jgi:hypothetical protein